MTLNSKFQEVRIGWTRGNAIVSKLIRRLDDSYFNHVYFKFTTNSNIKLIYESHLKGGVQVTPYEHLLSAKIHGKVELIHEDKLDLSPENVQLLWNNCLPHHGAEYDTRQILIYYAWIRLFRRKKGAKVLKLHKKGCYTCNELVVSAGKGIIPEFRDTDLSYTPESLFRLMHEGQTSKAMFGEPE